LPLGSMRDLLVLELQDIRSAEAQIAKMLPNMAKAASAPGLKSAFERHLAETDGQIARLDQCIAALGIPPSDTVCKGMEGLAAETRDMMDEEGPDPVLDAGLIGAAQRIEHYEIAAYRSAVAFAELLGASEVAALLRQNLDEETAADRTLSALATKEVNQTAVAAGTRISES